MHSSTLEPANAGFSRSKGVSTAEKKAEYARRGLEWPRYPDGTLAQWNCDNRKGGSWVSYESILGARARSRDRQARLRLLPGTCGRKDCTQPKHRHSTGTYNTYCHEHILHHISRRIGVGGLRFYV